MNIKLITRIKSEMQNVLSKEQIEILDNVLRKNLEPNNVGKDRKNLIKKFIAAKKIEGCSKRTEEYYESSLNFFENQIKCPLCEVKTEQIRDYLIKYQKINNCSNVTLDTLRRILSSFYKWLEEEDFIIKSPMKRIHRIKSPVIIKHTLTEEQVEILRNSTIDNIRNLATKAIDKGMPIEQVQILLGHSKIDTTLRYTNVQQENVKLSYQKYIC